MERKEKYLRLAVSVIIFASYYGRSLQSPTSPDCDLRYRIFEESQDNSFSSCRNITVMFCQDERKNKSGQKIEEKNRMGTKIEKKS